MANITKRQAKNGEISYRIRVSDGYNPDGTRRPPHVMTWHPKPGMTPKQIEKELNRVTVEFEEKCKNGLVQGDVRLADFCGEYLALQKDRLSPTVLPGYRKIIEKDIIPQLGHMKLKDLRPAHVQQFLQYLQGDVKQRRDGKADKDKPKLSAATVRRKLAVLQSILRTATKLELIPSNPADAKKLTLPRVTTPKTEFYTRQQAAEMLEYLEQEDLQFQTLIQLAIITGARAGELCALKFSDIDAATQRITIERSAYKNKGQPVMLKPPKDFECRSVTVNRHCIELINMLHDEKERTAVRLGSQWIGDEWIFTQWNGEIMHPQTPTQQWRKFLARHGLPHKKLHSLRHTSATLLLYGGVDIKAVQTRLGHSELTTTNKYLHLVQEADVQAANLLDTMLNITKTDNPNAVKEA